jgi:hypothetical protein
VRIPPFRLCTGYIAPMPVGPILWVVAMILTVTGLVAVLRQRLATGAILIPSGLVLGLLSSEYLG